MSRVSTVYDTILSVMATLFPNKTRIPNAYNLPNNNELFLRDGWGLRMDSGSQQSSEFCNFRLERGFTIVFTREVLKTDSQTTNEDTAVKALLEDVYTVQKDFLNVDQFGAAASIDFVLIGSSSAVTEFMGEAERFKSIEASFLINITEDL